jgi:hypothetical protein
VKTKKRLDFLENFWDNKNIMYWPSLQMLKRDDLWKKLPKHMKWTFMGMWSVEDSQFYTDHPEYKMEPNMAYLNKRKSNFKPHPRKNEEEIED